MLVPASAVATMFAGALIDRLARRADPAGVERWMLPLASGLIAGEALVAIVIPVLIVLGVLAA
jgi:uncharacterized oligopeptide transporter (OPT) family protein